jgi:hypothetical protein
LTGKLSDVAGMIVFPLVACVIVRTLLQRAPAERAPATCIAGTMIGPRAE